jgi:hypothetical protein
MRNKLAVFLVALVALLAAPAAFAAPANASEPPAPACWNNGNQPWENDSGRLTFYGYSVCNSDSPVDRLETTISVVRNGSQIASQKFVCVRNQTFCDGTVTYPDSIGPQTWCTYVSTTWYSALGNGAAGGPKYCEGSYIP